SGGVSRRQSRRFPARSSQLDELAFGGRMLLGEGLPDLDAEGPDVLRAEAAVVHEARVFTACEAGAFALRGEAGGLADALADRPAGLAFDLGEEGQVFDVLLAAAIGLEADRGDGAGILAGTGGVEEGEGVGFGPGVGGAEGLPGEDAVGAKGPGVE